MYARQVKGKELTFGVSGKLIMNALVMYDHQTGTLWSHFLGRAVKGPMKGTQLEVIPALQTTWERWKGRHPNTLVLEKRCSFGGGRYSGYFRSGAAGIMGETHTDDRLPVKERVIGVFLDGDAKAYGFRAMEDRPLVNDRVGGRPLLVVFDEPSRTGVVFSREVGDRTLTFEPTGGEPGRDGPGMLMLDRETGTRWDALEGTALSGPLKGEELHRMPSNYAFWFAWKDYHPETGVFEG